MKRRQVFVRATDPTGKWGTADVLDLDDESFRAFVVDVLFRAGLVCGIGDEFVDRETVEYRCTVAHEDEEE